MSGEDHSCCFVGVILVEIEHITIQEVINNTGIDPNDEHTRLTIEGRDGDVQQVRDRFAVADEVVNQFLDTFHSRWSENIANEVKWQDKPWSTTPLWLLTHTETHEFHHKGQIVSMTRHLGYDPPNTDLD